MKQFDYKPVIKPLYLKDYQPEYGEQCIEVCVNPRIEFMEERVQLIEENALRYASSAKFVPKQGAKLTDEETQSAQKKVQEYLDWFSTEFNDRADEWFGRLWSFGEDQWDLDDVKLIRQTDDHLLTWLKNRSLEMIDEHKAGRKKN